MKIKSFHTFLILIVFVMVVLQGCLPQDGQPDNSADTIATAVAATLEAGEGEESPPDTAAPPPSPTWTIHPQSPFH